MYTPEEVAFQEQAIGTSYLDKVQNLERLILSNPSCLIDLPVSHLFTDKMYVRTLYAPAGSLVTTKIHKTQHPFVVLKGKVSIVLQDGTVEQISAPYIGITEPGTQRVGYVHEDVIWATFHVNEDNTKDLAVIEDRVIERCELTAGRTSYELAQELMHQRLS